MKRTELRRGKPLASTVGLSRSSGLLRRARQPRQRAAAAPAARSAGPRRIPTAAVAAVRARSGGRCEIALPDVCLGAAVNRHHRRPRGMGGTRNPAIHSPANLLDLCGSGTTGCHGYLEAHRAQAQVCGWLLPAGVDPAATGVLIRGAWLLLADDGSTTPLDRTDHGS